MECDLFLMSIFDVNNITVFQFDAFGSDSGGINVK